MPLFGHSDSSVNAEVRGVEKQIHKEERSDEKSLSHAIDDLSRADKAHAKSIKAADKAQHALDKAVANEHKTAKALNKAAHTHDTAIADEQSAEKAAQIQMQHKARLEQDLEQKRQHLEELRSRKEQNDAARDSKLSELHSHDSAPGEVRSGPEDARATVVGDQ
ncbi:uncharacterized protein BXZ73DRAFT_78609 [Epithele typhae]|uniref:uncharacterized protein n=1 Tax=Epithele typhae TaxID=378194 RepID=UPI0020083080|nr:uncharacterized protein BXZ73DRAFT_78609 [Epithele typhae]KAH9927139.1 hypothetical protein BXZ73DRAFT_78609 [Epithele typhae]